MALITSSDDWWHILVIRLYYKFLPRKFLLLISKYMYVQTLLFHGKANMRTFPFDQKFRLNYWKFPVANGTACSRILRKGDNFIRYSQTEKCSTGSSVWFISSISPFEFPEFFSNYSRFGNLQLSEFPARSFISFWVPFPWTSCWYVKRKAIMVHA